MSSLHLMAAPSERALLRFLMTAALAYGVLSAAVAASQLKSMSRQMLDLAPIAYDPSVA